MADKEMDRNQEGGGGAAVHGKAGRRPAGQPHLARQKETGERERERVARVERERERD